MRYTLVYNALTILNCKEFYDIQFLFSNSTLIDGVQTRRLVVNILLDLSRFDKDAGSEKLLAEVSVVDLYAEDGLEKILKLADRKLPGQ